MNAPISSHLVQIISMMPDLVDWILSSNLSNEQIWLYIIGIFKLSSFKRIPINLRFMVPIKNFVHNLATYDPIRP